MTISLPPAGRSAFAFVDPNNPDLPLVVNVFRPEGYRPGGKVVFVQHGMLRNGDEYRDFWIEDAKQHDLLIIAPTFDNTRFPDARNYNDGMVRAENGAISPVSRWLYGIPGLILAALRAGGAVEGDAVYLYGHSAGGQFAHRLVATQGSLPFRAVIAANAGWYTLPLLERPFPEGLGDLGFARTDLARWFAAPMTLLAGDKDTDTADPNLPALAEALAQGPHRFARAHFMFELARDEAQRLDLPFNWSLVPVSGIGHDGAAMSRVAAAHWFGAPGDVAAARPSAGAVL